MKDVAGRDVEIGDAVAFCLGGTGMVMLVGEVVAINPKTVSIKAEAWDKWSGKPSVQVFLRRGDAVCKVEN